MTSSKTYIAGAAAVAAATTAISEWFSRSSKDNDPWEDKEIFNNRMAELQAFAAALQSGFTNCPTFLKDNAQLLAWRGVRDGFSSFYSDVGKLLLLNPNTAQVEQAKSYASKLYFWGGEYARLKCGAALAAKTAADPYAGPTSPPPTLPTDWVGIIKWGAIGLGGMFLLKTVKDLFGTQH